jgi:hypothetical protein
MLGDTGPLALGDEPLAGGMKHKPWPGQTKVLPQDREALGDPVNAEVRKQRPFPGQAPKAPQ